MSFLLLEADSLDIAKQLTHTQADLLRKSKPEGFMRQVADPEILTGDNVPTIIELGTKVSKVSLHAFSRVTYGMNELDFIMGSNVYPGAEGCQRKGKVFKVLC